ncbi:ATP-binding protein [Massilia sp. W12]|uniref:ATP-binding protein n=1 Tax=Massilia sp. W12 TaxID=3126507 RepID=UPI0030D5FEBC
MAGQRSLAHRFAYAAAALSGAVLLLSALSSWLLIERQQQLATRILTQREAGMNAQVLQIALTALDKRLNEAANSSLMANALVDSAGRQMYLHPYLRDMRSINGITLHILFADFEGKPIASIGDIALDAAQNSWLQAQIQSGQAQTSIFTQSNRSWLLMSGLMVYSRTQSPEGALVYKIALDDLQKLVTGKLLWGTQRAPAGAGELIVLRTPPAMQSLGLKLWQAQGQSISDARETSLGLILLFAAGASLIVLALGLRLAPALTRDVRELDDFARSIVQNGFGQMRAQVAGSHEVNSLAQSINHMLDKLHEQHQKLQQETEARYRLLVEGARVIYWEAAPEHFTLHYLSPQSASVTGWSQAQWLAPDFWQSHIHAEDWPALQAARRHISQGATGDNYQIEYRLQKPDGTWLWLEEIGSLAQDDGQSRLRGILLDIDMRKQSEARLAQERSRTDKMKSEFISTVSHELRTPLTSIRGALGLILGGAAGQITPQSQKLLTVAQSNCLRLLQLINDLLDIDKIASGKMEFNLQWLSLVELVQRALEENQSYAANYGVQYHLQIEIAPSRQVKLDAMRFMQVMANLLSNAAKFSPPNGVVEVRISSRDDMLRVEVTDHGSGIGPEFKAKIFQKFSQQDSSDTRAKGGAGLGLAISKALIEQMGGIIGFDSIPQQATTFHIELPG